MKKISKRFSDLKVLITKKSYPVQEAITLIKTFQSLKFEESVEAHISLNIDPKHANQQLRATLTLPNGIGKSLKIAVFTENDNIDTALSYGADIAGYEELIKEISQNNIQFDVLITTPQLMSKLTKLGKILGPKSLMPSPKAGTVTENVQQAIAEFKKGKIEYKADKTGIVHLIFGKTSFNENALIQNLLTIYESIEKNKPSGVKGKYLNSFYLCTTMSPSIQLDLISLKNQHKLT